MTQALSAVALCPCPLHKEFWKCSVQSRDPVGSSSLMLCSQVPVWLIVPQFTLSVFLPCSQWTLPSNLLHCDKLLLNFLKVHQIYWTLSKLFGLNKHTAASLFWVRASVAQGYQNCSFQQIWHFVTAVQGFPVSRNKREQTVISWSPSRRRGMSFPFTKQQFVWTWPEPVEVATVHCCLSEVKYPHFKAEPIFLMLFQASAFFLAYCLGSC